MRNGGRRPGPGRPPGSLSRTIEKQAIEEALQPRILGGGQHTFVLTVSEELLQQEFYCYFTFAVLGAYHRT